MKLMRSPMFICVKLKGVSCVCVFKVECLGRGFLGNRTLREGGKKKDDDESFKSSISLLLP